MRKAAWTDCLLNPAHSAEHDDALFSKLGKLNGHQLSYFVNMLSQKHNG